MAMAAEDELPIAGIGFVSAAGKSASDGRESERGRGEIRGVVALRRRR